MEALKLHLGSTKLGNSVDIRLEAMELPRLSLMLWVELGRNQFMPYVQRKLSCISEKITCMGIRPVPK